MPAVPQKPACISQNCVAGHFFEETADPANEIITGEERQIINTNDGGRKRRGSYARVQRDRNWKNVGESDAVEQMKGNEPAKRNLARRDRQVRRPLPKREIRSQQ